MPTEERQFLGAHGHVIRYDVTTPRPNPRCGGHRAWSRRTRPPLRTYRRGAGGRRLHRRRPRPPRPRTFRRKATAGQQFRRLHRRHRHHPGCRAGQVCRRSSSVTAWAAASPGLRPRPSGSPHRSGAVRVRGDPGSDMPPILIKLARSSAASSPACRPGARRGEHLP